jgi:hypothetical protein
MRGLTSLSAERSHMPDYNSSTKPRRSPTVRPVVSRPTPTMGISLGALGAGWAAMTPGLRSCSLAEGDCLPPSGAQLQLNPRSNRLQHAPKWRIWSETHGSIRVQEGEPNESSTCP